MRKAEWTVALGTLALALAGLIFGLALPVQSQGRANGARSNAALAGPLSQLLNSSKRLPEKTPANVVGVAKIAFASDRDGNNEIYTMDTDGGALTRLTENGAEDFNPAWSPDGS